MKFFNNLSTKKKDNDFWSMIALLDWSYEGDDEKVIEPVAAQLAKQTVGEIELFQETLAQKLYALDGEAWARESGSILWHDEQLTSADGFLYSRCVVVANGKEFYEHVLNNPGNMPKDVEFEALIHIASEALKRKTGNDDGIVTKTLFETYSNSEGWHRQ